MNSNLLRKSRLVGKQKNIVYFFKKKTKMIKLSSLVFRIEKETVENFSSDSTLNAFVGYQIRKRYKQKNENIMI